MRREPACHPPRITSGRALPKTNKPPSFKTPTYNIYHPPLSVSRCSTTLKHHPQLLPSFSSITHFQQGRRARVIQDCGAVPTTPFSPTNYVPILHPPFRTQLPQYFLERDKRRNKAPSFRRLHSFPVLGEKYSGPESCEGSEALRDEARLAS